MNEIFLYNSNYISPTSSKNKGSGRETARPLGCNERVLCRDVVPMKNLCRIILFQYVFQLHNMLRQNRSWNWFKVNWQIVRKQRKADRRKIRKILLTPSTVLSQNTNLEYVQRSSQNKRYISQNVQGGKVRTIQNIVLVRRWKYFALHFSPLAFFLGFSFVSSSVVMQSPNVARGRGKFFWK